MMTGSDKVAKIRALFTAEADEMFQALGKTLKPEQLQRLKQIMVQQWGIIVFDHKEVRDALKLNDETIAQLKSVHEQMQRDLEQQIISGKIARQDAQKVFNAFSRGVRTEFAAP
jgi:Mor family transcriptional regulator